MASNVLSLGLSEVMAAVLLSARVAAVLLMTPILNALAMPTPVRVLVVLVLALTLASGLPEPARAAAAATANSSGLFVALLSELAIGATMALGIHIAFGAIAIAGRLLDVQIGYGIAQVFDPATQRQMPILTSIFSQLGTFVFFISDFHHTLLRGLAFSLDRVPLDHAWSLTAVAVPVLHHAAGLFSLGFLLVAPIMFCMLMLEFGLAVLSRNVPQMHLFSLSHAFKIVVGIVAILLWLAGAPQAMARLYQAVFQLWEVMFSNG